MQLLLLFLTVPLIEIALFITVGEQIGLIWTLLIVVITAIIGASLVRSQGAGAIARLRRNLSDLEDPTEALVHGAMILFAGALLLTPGFFTDAVGFSLLVPGVRTWLFRVMQKRMTVHVAGFSEPRRPGQRHDDVVEGTYEEVEPPVRGNSPRPSKWSSGDENPH